MGCFWKQLSEEKLKHIMECYILQILCGRLFWFGSKCPTYAAEGARRKKSVRLYLFYSWIKPCTGWMNFSDVKVVRFCYSGTFVYIFCGPSLWNPENVLGYWLSVHKMLLFVIFLLLLLLLLLCLKNYKNGCQHLKGPCSQGCSPHHAIFVVYFTFFFLLQKT